MTAFLISALRLLATAPCLGQAAPTEGLEIRGKVVDIETGRPISNFIVQDGRPDPDAPGRMSWDAGEFWSSFNPSGSLSTTLTKKRNWTRVVAPGYVPQPITEKPYDGRPGTINVTVKLRRGWKIAGLVLDSSRKPVAGASLFLVGGRMTGPNITGGKAWHVPEPRMPLEDQTVTKAVTNGEGRFVLDGVGGYETAIAVSAPGLDLWLYQPVPALERPCEIVLPAPGKLVIRYNIEGGEPEATVSLRWLEEWKVARNERERKVANRGRLVLEDLAPGTYHVERRKTLGVAGALRSPRLELLAVVVESGKTSEVALVREIGAAVEGEIIGLEKLKLPGAFIYIVKP